MACHSYGKLLSPALTRSRAGLTLNTPAIARVATVSGGALALADDAVRVRRVVLAAAAFEAAFEELSLLEEVFC